MSAETEEKVVVGREGGGPLRLFRIRRREGDTVYVQPTYGVPDIPEVILRSVAKHTPELEEDEKDILSQRDIVLLDEHRSGDENTSYTAFVGKKDGNTRLMAIRRESDGMCCILIPRTPIASGTLEAIWRNLPPLTKREKDFISNFYVTAVDYPNS